MYVFYIRLRSPCVSATRQYGWSMLLRSRTAAMRRCLLSTNSYNNSHRYIHIHAYIHTNMQTNVLSYTHAYTHSNIRTYTHTYRPLLAAVFHVYLHRHYHWLILRYISLDIFRSFRCLFLVVIRQVLAALAFFQCFFFFLLCLSHRCFQHGCLTCNALLVTRVHWLSCRAFSLVHFTLILISAHCWYRVFLRTAHVQLVQNPLSQPCTPAS